MQQSLASFYSPENVLNRNETRNPPLVCTQCWIAICRNEHQTKTKHPTLIFTPKNTPLRKLKLYIAGSLNGKIARSDGSVDWLESIPNPTQTDHGYSLFYDSIDTTIQGYTTYKQIIEWDIPFPYAEKKNYVLTSQSDLEDTNFVEFVSQDHSLFIEELKRESGKDIWLIGGGHTNTKLLNEGLIDEIQVFMMPIIIPKGITLFEAVPKEAQLTLLNTTSYSSGAVELQYRVN